MRQINLAIFAWFARDCLVSTPFYTRSPSLPSSLQDLSRLAWGITLYVEEEEEEEAIPPATQHGYTSGSMCVTVLQMAPGL